MSFYSIELGHKFWSKIIPLLLPWGSYLVLDDNDMDDGGGDDDDFIHY